jgi:hypothetical protein
MNATLHTNFTRSTRPGFRRSALNLFEVEEIRRSAKFFRSFAFAERAKRARQGANVRVIYVSIVHERDDVPTLFLAQLIRRLANLIKILTTRLKTCDDVVFVVLVPKDCIDRAKNSRRAARLTRLFLPLQTLEWYTTVHAQDVNDNIVCALWPSW